MNKKGFTLVELLAVICILGVLGTIGIASTRMYIVQSRKKSYKMMSQSIYEATMNCIIQNKCQAPTTDAVKIDTGFLIDNGYIKELKNPISNNKPCSGTIIITNESNIVSEYQKYKYEVELTCDGVAKNKLSWPDEKSKETPLKDIGIK